jgi:3-hydroxy-3-methylglutaryl CoA synthase
MAKNPLVRIKNYTGIPVLHVAGELNAEALRQIAGQVQRLVDAGHYHIVFDLKRAALAGIRGLRAVNDVARALRRHYGSLYIVADLGQERAIRRLGLPKGASFCRSEEHAVSKILGGYYRPVFGQRGVSARLPS